MEGIFRYPQNTLWQTRILVDPNCIELIHIKPTKWQKFLIWLEDLCCKNDLIYPFNPVKLITTKPAIIKLGNNLICHPDIYKYIKEYYNDR